MHAHTGQRPCAAVTSDELRREISLVAIQRWRQQQSSSSIGQARGWKLGVQIVELQVTGLALCMRPAPRRSLTLGQMRLAATALSVHSKVKADRYAPLAKPICCECERLTITIASASANTLSPLAMRDPLMRTRRPADFRIVSVSPLFQPPHPVQSA